MKLFGLCGLSVVIPVMLFISCINNRKDRVVAPWGIVTDTVSGNKTFDLEQIINNGEIIMATLSGPDSYYDYHGGHLGMQFLLCQKFADKLGVRLRVELCRDTLEMIYKLIDGDVDIVAYWLALPDIGMRKDIVNSLSFCGPRNNVSGKKWIVAENNDGLLNALNQWFKPSLLLDVKKEEAFMLSSKSVKRHVYAPMLDRRNGIISPYDYLFVKYGSRMRWDWRLLAAQCYQESTFDPNAKSWAGACGLMQLMPDTYSYLGLSSSEVFIPELNIEAATRYLSEIEHKFSDINNRNEKINFVLASYNGGYHHIRDAMRITDKNGKNSKSWQDVSKYVLLLREPQYFRDSIVKYGYMRGDETVDYVAKIRQRWRQYCSVNGLRGGVIEHTPQKAKYQKKKFRLAEDSE